jgi:hypothetical protein
VRPQRVALRLAIKLKRSQGAPTTSWQSVISHKRLLVFSFLYAWPPLLFSLGAEYQNAFVTKWSPQPGDLRNIIEMLLCSKNSANPSCLLYEEITNNCISWCPSALEFEKNYRKSLCRLLSLEWRRWATQ